MRKDESHRPDRPHTRWDRCCSSETVHRRVVSLPGEGECSRSRLSGGGASAFVCPRVLDMTSAGRGGAGVRRAGFRGEVRR